MTKWMIGLLASTALIPAAANAQSNDESVSVLGEVVVTAQRYEQRLQDVPVSISAITAAELEARKVSTLDELQYSVPGLSTYEYGVGQQFVQLRGVSNSLGSSTVGSYFDETPLTLDRQGNGVNIRLLDLERVEVLRGPQATLYGEGSMGGTIRYIPAAPRLDAVSGSVEGEYSSTEDGGSGYLATGVLNLPLGDMAAVRLVAGYERVGGFIDSVATGEEDVDKADILTLRGALLVRPNDRLDISLTALYQDIDQDYQAFGNDRETVAIVPTSNDDEYTLIQAKADYDFDFATLTASTSFIDRANTVVADLSGAFVPYLPLFGIPAGTVTQVGLPTSYDYDVYNAEVRLTSQGEDALGWTVGASYRDVSLALYSETEVGPGTVPFTLLLTDQQIEAESFTAFAEVNYKLTPQLTATLGGRYFEQKLDQTSRSISFGATALDVNSGKFDSFNPRLNVAYTFSRNSMAYANVSKGFRGGGFNLTSAGGGVVDVPPTFDPDEIWTYEVGTKHQLFDNRLILDAAVYRSEWSDVQSYGFAPGSPLVIVSNSGDVSGWGTDLSVTARPADGLTLTATYGWNNLEFQETTADKNAGDPVDGAVRESYSASLDYRRPVANNIEGFFRVDYQHADASQITLRNFGQIVERPGRDLVNIRVGADIGDLQLSVFANNLFDEDAPNIIGPFGVFSESLEQRPRVIGVNVLKKI